MYDAMKSGLMRAGHDESKVTAALSSLNLEAIEEEVSKDWRLVLWDGKEPINGRDAETVKKAHARVLEAVGEGAAIYLIKNEHTGRVQYFQPMKPGVPGFQSMTDDEAVDYGVKHLAQFVQSLVEARVKQEVESLLK